jgi:hypothetical protein
MIASERLTAAKPAPTATLNLAAYAQRYQNQGDANSNNKGREISIDNYERNSYTFGMKSNRIGVFVCLE